MGRGNMTGSFRHSLEGGTQGHRDTGCCAFLLLAERRHPILRAPAPSQKECDCCCHRDSPQGHCRLREFQNCPLLMGGSQVAR